MPRMSLIIIALFLLSYPLAALGQDDGAATAEGIQWVSIPSGSFQMGCDMPKEEEAQEGEQQAEEAAAEPEPEPEENAEEEEKEAACAKPFAPAHKVEVGAFQLMATEVTQAQYEAVIGVNPSRFADCGGNCPVDSVNLAEAEAFCKAIGGRLPTEAEFEYAARTGAQQLYICGDTLACLDPVAWYGKNADGKTHPVATKEANGFGLYDMAGNVNEWVADCWHVTFKQKEDPEEATENPPVDGSAWTEHCSIERGVVRGGNWFSKSEYMGAARRIWADRDYHSYTNGVRCAK